MDTQLAIHLLVGYTLVPTLQEVVQFVSMTFLFCHKKSSSCSSQDPDDWVLGDAMGEGGSCESLRSALGKRVLMEANEIWWM